MVNERTSHITTAVRIAFLAAVVATIAGIVTEKESSFIINTIVGATITIAAIALVAYTAKTIISSFEKLAEHRKRA